MLPVGVVAGDDDRNRESSYAEYSAWSGVDIHTVQVMAGNYTTCIKVEPEGYTCLLEKTYREEINENVAIQRVY